MSKNNKHPYPRVFFDIVLTPYMALGISKSVFGTTNAVYNQLKIDYRKKDISWVLAAQWSEPGLIDTGKIDMSNRKDWDIDKKKVRKFEKMMKDEGYNKPIVLVKVSNNEKMIIVDGHHHTLAAKKLGIQVMAYIAVVGSVRGPWETIRRNQKHGRTSAGNEFDGK